MLFRRDLLRNEKGMALVVALLAVVLVSMLVTSIVFLSGADISFSVNHKDSKRALDIAEAGIAKAVWYLENPGQIPMAANGYGDPPPGPSGGSSSVNQWNWQNWRPSVFTEKYGEGSYQFNVETVSGTPCGSGGGDCLDNWVVRITSKGIMGSASRTVSRMFSLTPAAGEFAVMGMGGIEVKGGSDMLLAPREPGRWVTEDGRRKLNQGGGIGGNGVLNFQDEGIRMNDPDGSSIAPYPEFFGSGKNQGLPGGLIKAGSQSKVTVKNGTTDYTEINALRERLPKLYGPGLKKIAEPISAPRFNWGLDSGDTPFHDQNPYSWYNQAVGINPFFVGNQAVSRVGGIGPPSSAPGLPFPYNTAGAPLGSPGISIAGNPVAGEYAVSFDNENTLEDPYGTPYKTIEMSVERKTLPPAPVKKITLSQKVDYDVRLDGYGTVAPFNVITPETASAGSVPLSAISPVPGEITTTTSVTWDIYVYNDGGIWKFEVYKGGDFYTVGSHPLLSGTPYTDIIPGLSITTGNLSCGPTTPVHCPTRCGPPNVPCNQSQPRAWQASFMVSAVPKTYYQPVSDIPPGITLNFTDGHPLNGEKAAFSIAAAARPMFQNKSGAAVENVFDWGSVWDVGYDGSTYYTISKKQKYTLTVNGSGDSAEFDVTSLERDVPSGVEFKRGPFSAAAGTETSGAIPNFDIIWSNDVKSGDSVEITTGNPVEALIIDEDFTPEDTYTLQVTESFGGAFKVYLRADSTGNEVPNSPFTVHPGETISVLTDGAGKTASLKFGDILTNDAHAHLFTRGIIYDETVSPPKRHPDLKNVPPDLNPEDLSKPLLEEINRRFDNYRANMRAFSWDQSAQSSQSAQAETGTSGIPNHIYGNFYLRSNPPSASLPPSLILNGNNQQIRGFSELVRWMNRSGGEGAELRGINYVWMRTGEVLSIEKHDGVKVKDGALIIDGALSTGTQSELVIQHPNRTYPIFYAGIFTEKALPAGYSGPAYLEYLPGLMVRKVYNGGQSVGFTSLNIGQSAIHVDGAVYSAQNAQLQGSLFITGALVADSLDSSPANPSLAGNNGLLAVRYDKEHVSKMMGKLNAVGLPLVVATPLAESWIDKLIGFFE